MLTIQEFIKENKYDIDQLYVDEFWNTLNEEKWILLTDKRIDMIGFDGKRQSKKNQNCLNLIKKTL